MFVLLKKQTGKTKMETPKKITPLNSELPTAHPAGELLAALSQVPENHLPTSHELATHHMGQIVAHSMLERVTAGGHEHTPEDHRHN
jgi:hypothetical protein